MDVPFADGGPLPDLTTEEYRALFDNMDEGYCVIEFFDGPHGPNSDYIHIAANAAYERHAGIPNVVGQKLREMVPDEADAWIARYGAVLETGEPIRFEQELVATGRVLELSSFRLEPASAKHVAVLFQDVTERRKAERSLKELNENLERRINEAVRGQALLSDVVEHMNAFVQVADLDYNWLAINEASANEFERLFGIKPRTGDNMLSLLDTQPDNRAQVEAVWKRALDGEEFIEVQQFGGGDYARHYEMRFNTLRDLEGNRIGAYQFVYDVTDRIEEQRRLRDAEEALRQSQKMEAVGQLTGGLAHDFNNLLAAISGAFEMIGTRLAQGRTADVEKYLTAGAGATRRAAALTHRLLAFARRQTLQPRPVVINSLLGDTVELIKRTVGPQITVETVAAAGLWPAMLDPNQLENALLNLCINARDAMPEGGKITIETANRWIDRQQASVRGIEPGQYATICVSDTGVGIPKDVMPRIFDPFFTTKPLGEGTGLGLSMVYGFARQSNGHVSAYSEPGQGTMICIYMPRFLGDSDDVGARELELPGLDSHDGDIALVVDDEPMVRMLMVDALQELGVACLEAENGSEAQRLLESDQRIDLLVTDVGLPGGMNGRQIADLARTLRSDLPVLFVTGYAENAALDHGHVTAGIEVLTKPFAVEDLKSRANRLLLQRQEGQG